jgi:hypothetical protein
MSSLTGVRLTNLAGCEKWRSAVVGDELAIGADSSITCFLPQQWIQVQSLNYLKVKKHDSDPYKTYLV